MERWASKPRAGSGRRARCGATRREWPGPSPGAPLGVDLAARPGSRPDGAHEDRSDSRRPCFAAPGARDRMLRISAGFAAQLQGTGPPLPNDERAAPLRGEVGSAPSEGRGAPGPSKESRRAMTGFERG